MVKLAKYLFIKMFRGLGNFNRVLVGKCVWRSLINRHSLWARVIEFNYEGLDLNELRVGEVGNVNRWSIWWRDAIENVKGVGGGNGFGKAWRYV